MQNHASVDHLAATEIAPQHPGADAWTISDSFHWDLHESLGVLMLGTLVFVLLGALIHTYERLLRAYAGDPPLATLVQPTSSTAANVAASVASR